jgi:hypothetical protein
VQARFDWEYVLRELGVDYTTKGKNVGRGEINIKCPWCGPNDPSHHLGIGISSKTKQSAWRCWRNKTHSGHSTSYLLTKLVGRQRTLGVLRKYGLESANVRQAAPRAAEGDNEPAARPCEFKLPAGVYRFDSQFDFAHHRYLLARGFRGIDVAAIAEQFQLCVGRHGEYAGRLVIPYLVGNVAVHFTARAIAASHLRFKASPNDLAVFDPKELVYNSDAIENPAGVLLVEGPLDAIKASVYGPLPAVALSTNSASKSQIAVLKRARRVIILTDNDHIKTHAHGEVTVAALTLFAELMRAGISVSLQPMVRGFKDLAEIPWDRYPELVNVDTLLASH